MYLKKIVIVALSLGACFLSLHVYAQHDTGNKKQMRQLAYDYCKKSATAEVCGCFADNLVKNFNEKEWSLFVADATNSPAPPAGVDQGHIDSYGKKLSNAGQVCGVR